MPTRAFFILLLVGGCSAASVQRSATSDPAPVEAGTTVETASVKASADASRERRASDGLMRCATFRINTEDTAGDIPEACKGLLNVLPALTQRCQTDKDGASCYVAGLLTLGEVPTSVGFSLRVPPGRSWASTTLMVHERIAEPRDRGDAARLMAIGCRAGHQGACEMLLLTGLPAQDVGFPRAILGALCADANSPGACAKWVYEVMATRGMQTEDDGRFTQATRTLLRTRCDLGKLRSCNNLGVAEIMWGNAGGHVHLTKACTAGSEDPRLDGRSAACANLISLRLHRRNFRRSKANFTVAAQVLDDACTRGDDTSCLYLALAQRAGLGVKKDRNASRAAVRALCGKGYMDACRHK